MAKLEINTSDLLGKLHRAAMEKVNDEFKGVWNKVKKAFKTKGGGIGGDALIENSAFHKDNEQLNPPPNGNAEIIVKATGTRPMTIAKQIFATYMKWFAGMDEAKANAKFDEYSKKAGKSDSNAHAEGAGVLKYELTIEYELTTTEKKPEEIEKTEDDSSSDNDASSEDSDVINANESEEQTTEKKNIWESHPFESIFKEQEKATMTTESKTENFVKEVMNKKNVKAQNTLESILKYKIYKRVKETLEENSEKKS